LDLTDISWVIVGGESGSKARPLVYGWARDIRDRCIEAGIPFFFKQDSGLRAGTPGPDDLSTYKEFPS
jgi:protein gp37